METPALVSRLREIRRGKRIPQGHVAEAVGLSPSEVSRIERGRRRFPVHLLEPWVSSLDLRLDMIFWDDPEGGVEVLAGVLDAESFGVLRQIAASLPHMPEPARQALVHQARVWREAEEGEDREAI